MIKYNLILRLLSHANEEFGSYRKSSKRRRLFFRSKYVKLFIYYEMVLNACTMYIYYNIRFRDKQQIANSREKECRKITTKKTLTA